MGNPIDIESTFTADEIQAAISGLTEADWARLYLFAAKFARLRRISDRDVVHAALIAALSGARKCPRHLKVIPFLYGAMKSQTSAALKDTDPLVRAESLEAIIDQEDIIEEGYLLKNERNPEKELIAQDQIQTLYGFLAGDEVAIYVLMSILDGSSVAETCDVLDITRTQYESSRRKINRCIDKLKMQVACV
jgi:DNA-directed RNA polymerase specialized sigma24 family protein